MATELVVTSFALILFAYWFRYNCRLILRNKSSVERGRQVALANRLHFPEVTEVLLQQPPSAKVLDTINGTVQQEYHILICLLRYSAGPQGATYTVDQRLLMVDFKLLQMWYRLTRKHILQQARWSLEEQLHILNYFANAMGERRAAVSRA